MNSRADIQPCSCKHLARLTTKPSGTGGPPLRKALFPVPKPWVNGWPILSLRSNFPVPELWVPRPCAFCKGGYGAADTMRAYACRLASHLRWSSPALYQLLPVIEDCLFSAQLRREIASSRSWAGSDQRRVGKDFVSRASRVERSALESFAIGSTARPCKVRKDGAPSSSLETRFQRMGHPSPSPHSCECPFDLSSEVIARYNQLLWFRSNGQPIDHSQPACRYYACQEESAVKINR